MSKDEKEIPIRMVKKKGGHGGHHGGAWKVAYADFVTAMMALFIVLWILSQGQEVKESVASYFKDPGVFETTKGGINTGNATGKPGPPALDDFISQQKKNMEAMATAVKQALKAIPGIENLEKQVEIHIVKEGLRFELIETKESTFFDIGTSNLREDKKAVLIIIAEKISQMSNRIIIEGHTDSRQYPSPLGYTNFELSGDRANSARRFMIEHGLRPEQVEEIRGYADSRLRNPQDPLDACNRRISILLKYIEDPGIKGGTGIASIQEGKSDAANSFNR